MALLASLRASRRWYGYPREPSEEAHPAILMAGVCHFPPPRHIYALGMVSSLHLEASITIQLMQRQEHVPRSLSLLPASISYFPRPPCRLPLRPHLCLLRDQSRLHAPPYPPPIPRQLP